MIFHNFFQSPKNKTKIITGFAFLCCALLSACEQKTETPAVPTTVDNAPAQPLNPAIEPATEKVWKQGADTLNTALTESQKLRDAIHTLLAKPDTDTLSATKLAWHRAHDTYQAFQLYIAIGDSNPGLFGQLIDTNFSIDTWPIQPGFLDYFDVYEHSGMVNDIAMPLTADALRQQHGLTDVTDVSLGFHAMEYLIWGENGQRPVSDLTEDTQLTPDQQATELRIIDLPANRRRILLQLMSELLVDDLQQLSTRWANETDNFYQQYFALQPVSRVELLRRASIHWLDKTITHLEILSAQHADVSETPATDIDSEFEAPESVHNVYAGDNANGIARSLGTLEQWFFVDDEQGLSIMEPELQTELATKLAALNDQLYGWHDQSWPPTGKAKEEITGALIAVSEGLNPVEEVEL